ncbi:MAG: DUF917 family protein [Clostridia bacterium]|nr:DUF917 family protein [Clostridia bacterium]
MFELTRENGQQMLLGGWFLGGGGGGLPEGGQEILELVLKTGTVRFVSLEELAGEDLLVTASLVGSPASPDSCVAEHHYRQVYQDFLAADDRPIAAFVTNENGGHSITNGWMLAALTGRPMVDAACNGRAHPTGVMGAMGLHALPGYRALQTAAGGKGAREIALTVSGTVEQTSAVVRNAATLAGGYVTVLRNPATVDYFRENSAVGCISQAREVGQIWQENMETADKLLAALKDLLDCRELGRGTVRDITLRIEGGFDVGLVQLDTPDGLLTVDFMNEYMTVQQNERRLATFPDLIALIDTDTRLPVCSAQLKAGQKVSVVCVPREKLKLGRGMFLPELFEPCEKAMGKKLFGV